MSCSCKKSLPDQGDIKQSLYIKHRQIQAAPSVSDQQAPDISDSQMFDFSATVKPDQMCLHCIDKHVSFSLALLQQGTAFDYIIAAA